jgi:hypothetical protein
MVERRLEDNEECVWSRSSREEGLVEKERRGGRERKSVVERGGSKEQRCKCPVMLSFP